jgi:DNA recombination protein RmuC
VIRQAESFKLLGVEVKRDISPALAEQAQAATAITEESKPSALSPAVSAANDLP